MDAPRVLHGGVPPWISEHPAEGAIGSVPGAPADFVQILDEACSASNGWSVVPDRSTNPTWLFARPSGCELPAQGWKLHISADPVTSEPVLTSILPALTAARAAFKVAASRDVLAWLNVGSLGHSQIGKFVTVYPTDDESAVDLARRLLEATASFLAPAVPSDHPLVPGGAVHYRYGTFLPRSVRTPIGGIEQVIVTPDGDTAPDRRSSTFKPPSWVPDPFVAAGLTSVSKPRLLLGGRFLLVASLHRSGDSNVFLATDLDRGGTCVVKQASPYLHRALRREAEVLRALPRTTTRPDIVDLVEDGHDLLLALEDIPGETLDRAARRAVAGGEAPPVARWGTMLAGALAAVHQQGLVFGDVTPANAIVTPQGDLRLIDFALAAAPTTDTLPFGAGTPGFASPEQLAADGLDPRDDVYGLGAVLHVALANAAPRLSGDGDLATRLQMLSPGAPPGLVAVIERCLAPTRRERYPTMAAAGEALAAVASLTFIRPAWGSAPASAPEAEARDRAQGLASQLGDLLCDEARESDDGLWWLTPAVEERDGMRYRDINGGDAGIVLALAGLVRLLDDDRHRHVLREAARALGAGPREPMPLPGLYVGESGIGLALLRAGQATGDESFVRAAERRSSEVRAFPHVSPDLFNGTAGRLLFHLALHAHTGSAGELEAAIACGEFLIATAEHTDEGLFWRIPDGYEDLSGTVRLGRAHGASGIGDVLLDLFDATGERRWLDAAAAAGRVVAAGAVAIADGRGMQWPEVRGGEPTWACWCVGAGGIGRFIHRLATRGGRPEGIDLAKRAAWSVARTTRWAEPIQCHGVAGNVELLLDMYTATRDETYLREARSLAELLEAVASTHVVGRGALDYLGGIAGVLATQVRLADPEQARHVVHDPLTRTSLRA